MQSENGKPETTRPRYRYRVVAGASVWGKQCSIREARQRVAAMRTNRPDAEVERVLELDRGRRYWRWRNGRWSLKDHYDPASADLARWDFAPSIAEIANAA